jgi:hypothetical protein
MIAERHQRLVWLAPSRDENVTGAALLTEPPEILVTNIDGATVEDGLAPKIQGGRERGVILHKLIEEVLTGETAETEPALLTRAPPNSPPAFFVPWPCRRLSPCGPA